MNGRHARGWGISAHEMTNTTTKKAANSIVGKLTAGILAVAAVLPVAPVAAQGAGGSALVVGDSLEVGSAPYLRGALAGVPLELDAKRSRSSSEGLRVLASKLGPEHEVVVFPLGTNDFSASRVRIEPGRRSGAGRAALHGGGHDRAPQPARLLDRRSQPRGGAVRGDGERPGGGLALGRAVHTRRARARSHPRVGTGVCPASKPAGGGGAGLPAGREPGRHTRARRSECEGARRAVGAPRARAGHSRSPSRPPGCRRRRRSWPSTMRSITSRRSWARRCSRRKQRQPRPGPSPCWGPRRTDWCRQWTAEAPSAQSSTSGWCLARCSASASLTCCRSPEPAMR